MSREIKFRAWNKTEKKMYQVVDMYFGKSGELQTVRLLADHNGMQYPTNDIPVCEVELMQYAGMNDKNGNEIYEGDIVQQHHFYDTQGAEQFLTHIVEWSDKYSGWFALSADSMDESDGSQQLWVYIKSGSDTRVIGNIYENPELLEIK